MLVAALALCAIIGLDGVSPWVEFPAIHVAILLTKVFEGAVASGTVKFQIPPLCTRWSALQNLPVVPHHEGYFMRAR